MRAHLIKPSLLGSSYRTRLPQYEKQFPRRAFPLQLVAEPLHVTVLPRTSRFNVPSLDASLRQPLLQRPGDEHRHEAALDVASYLIFAALLHQNLLRFCYSDATGWTQ